MGLFRRASPVPIEVITTHIRTQQGLFEAKIYRGRSKTTLRMTVEAGPCVVVSAPRRTSMREITDFIREREGWIIRCVYSLSSKNEVSFPQLPTRRALYAHAQDIIKQRLIELNSHYGLTWNRITVKQIKSRWGSCSTDGNLNFNIRVAFLPEELRDYVVVHELCHRKEMNHSLGFWKLVEQVIPDHKERRKQLRTYSCY